MKISTKVLLSFLIIIVITAFSVIFFISYNFRSTIKAETGKQQLQTARQVMREIDIFLYERLQNIKTIGQAPPIIQALVSGDIGLLAKADKKLNEFFSSTGPWNNLIVLNTKGDVVVSTYDIKDVSKRLGIEFAFQSAIKGKIYYSDAVLSFATGKPTVFFAYPMKNTEAINSPIVGVVVGELAWPAITEYLEKIQEPVTAHLYNSQGILISSNNFEYQEEVLKSSLKDSPVGQIILNSKDAINEIPNVHEDFKSLTTNVNEQGYLTYKGNNWILALEMPISLVYASIKDSIFKVILMSTTLAIFYFIFLYFLIQAVFVKEIVEVSSAMNKIAMGNFGLKLKVKTNDEIGQLSMIFNQMAEKLNNLYNNLEENVRLKTKDLLQKNKELEETQIAIVNLLKDLNIEKESLVHTNAKDEALLDSIGDGVVAVDQGGKIILINQVAEQMLGQKSGQLIGKLLLEAWRVVDEKGNQVSKENRPITIALSGKTTTTTTTTMGPSYFYTRKDGTVFPVAINATPVIVDKEIIGAVDVFRDITKEKQAEKLRMDFLSLASHQLRTPLSGTKWLIETMQKKILGAINPKQKNYLNQIYQLNERMIQLVTEMLGVLRIESETGFAKKEVFLVSNLDKNIFASMAAMAESKKVVLRSNLKNYKTLTVNTNLEIIKSILECFISNAINYSAPRQEVLLNVEEKETNLVFSVRDNGIGIPKDEQKQIFQKFYRASNAKALVPGGSGLGLNIAKTLAEKISAEVSFESEKGKGSTFYLRIPKEFGTIAKLK